MLNEWIPATFDAEPHGGTLPPNHLIGCHPPDPIATPSGHTKTRQDGGIVQGLPGAARCDLFFGVSLWG